jgi:hypothetical protein
MTRILILIALVMTTPISAKADKANKDDKDAIRLSFSQNDIEAAYRYDSRVLAEQLVGLARPVLSKKGHAQKCCRSRPIDASQGECATEPAGGAQFLVMAK